MADRSSVLTPPSRLDPQAAPAPSPRSDREERGASRDRFTESPTTHGVEEEQELGRGRSGVVYASRDASGHHIVRKVFGASGLEKAVQIVLLGAPNPYAWCEAAVRSAVLRRHILADLVRYWFGDKLSVARALDHRWNPDVRAYEMRCDLVKGRHVALRHCFSVTADQELADLRRKVMKPLQDHLEESGFDGLVWQAGRGNPVALNNFMREGSDGRGSSRWVWIDLESGVPALFPLNPLDLLRFYLPRSLRHRRPLFDDVDFGALHRYVAKHRGDLHSKLGSRRLRRFERNVDALAEAQREWKSLPRLQRSIGYRRARGAIDDKQAQWYAKHPLHWYSREVGQALRSTPERLSAGLTRIINKLRQIDLTCAVKACWKATWSQAYRERMAREYVDARVTQWAARGQMSERHAATLRARVHGEESSAYLTDFGVHLAVKPLVKIAQFWIMPALWMAGMVSEFWVAFFMLAGGSIARSVYTLARLLQNAVRGRERPWVALGTGTLPVIGNVAFPIQILSTGTDEEHAVARFILHDTFSRLGRWVPIWGGPDTLTEHVLNRLPDRSLRKRARIGASTNSVQTHRAVDHSRTAAPEPVPIKV